MHLYSGNGQLISGMKETRPIVLIPIGLYYPDSTESVAVEFSGTLRGHPPDQQRRPSTTASSKKLKSLSLSEEPSGVFPSDTQPDGKYEGERSGDSQPERAGSDAGVDDGDRVRGTLVLGKCERKKLVCNSSSKLLPFFYIVFR